LFNEREKARKVRLGVVREDQSELSGKLLTEVYKLRALEIKELTDRRIAKDELAEGLVDVIVFIGPGYHERIEELDLGDLFYADDGRLSGSCAVSTSTSRQARFCQCRADRAGVGVRLCAQDNCAGRVEAQTTRNWRRSSSSRPSGPPPNAPMNCLRRTNRRACAANARQHRLSDSGSLLHGDVCVLHREFHARSFITEAAIGTLNRLRIAPVTRID